MVLAGLLALFMLIAGGFGGMINASYQMNTLVHNTQWVTGHFPSDLRRHHGHYVPGGGLLPLAEAVPARTCSRAAWRSLNFGLWGIGMLVLTLPWHALGLLGQPRRISSAPYDSPLVAQWDPHEAAMIVGGAILTGVGDPVHLQLGHDARSGAPGAGEEAVEFAVAVYPPITRPQIDERIRPVEWHHRRMDGGGLRLPGPAVFHPGRTWLDALGVLIDMQKPLITILLYSLLSCLGYAEPSTNVAWTPDLKRLVLSGDADQGAEIETVETEDVNACTDCHGVAGAEPDREKHPMLASQMATYTYKQLLDYKDGKRKNRRMQEAVERARRERTGRPGRLV